MTDGRVARVSAEALLATSDRAARIARTSVSVLYKPLPDVVGVKDIIVEFANGTGLGSTPTWTNVSSRVKRVKTFRGRQHDEDQYAPGTLEIALDDSDGRFDPENTSGPYYGALAVNYAWRVSFPGTYIAYGYTDGYSRTWPGGMEYSETTVHCTDRFKLFNKNTFGPITRAATAPGEGTDVRIDAILDALAVGATSSSRQINTAAYTARNVEATTYPAKTNGLSALQDINKAEGGVLFVNGAGVVVYKVTAARANDYVSNTSQATYQFGTADVAGAFDVEGDLNPVYDDELFANYVRVTDSASVEHVWPAVYPADPVEFDLGATLLNGVDAGFRARDLYSDRFAVRSRVPQAALECASSSAYRNEALAREISDRVTLVIGPRGGGATVTQDYFIESISHEIDVDAGQWLFQCDIDPVPLSFDPLDDDFTRADATPATPGPQGYSYSHPWGSAPRIHSNHLGGAADDWVAIVGYAGVATSDFDWSYEFVTGSSRFGQNTDIITLYFRYLDANNFCHVELTSTTADETAIGVHGFALGKRVAGVDTMVGTDFDQTLYTSPGETHTLRIALVGTTLTGYLDGVAQVTVTGFTALPGGKGVGVQQRASDGYGIRLWAT